MSNRLTVKEAARLMEAGEQFIRMGLQSGTLPIGCAVKTSTHWTYHISARKLGEYLGVALEKPPHKPT